MYIHLSCQLYIHLVYLSTHLVYCIHTHTHLVYFVHSFPLLFTYHCAYTLIHTTSILLYTHFICCTSHTQSLLYITYTFIMSTVHTHTLAHTNPKSQTLQENSSSKLKTSISNLGLPKIEL